MVLFWGGYKRNILLKNGIISPEGIHLGEDNLFKINFLSQCKNICIIDDQMYHYIARQNSCLNAARYDRWDNVIKMWDYIQSVWTDIPWIYNNAAVIMGRQIVWGLGIQTFNPQVNATWNESQGELKGIYNKLCKWFIPDYKNLLFKYKVIIYLFIHQQWKMLFLLFRGKMILKRK